MSIWNNEYLEKKKVGFIPHTWKNEIIKSLEENIGRFILYPGVLKAFLSIAQNPEITKKQFIWKVFFYSACQKNAIK